MSQLDAPEGKSVMGPASLIFKIGRCSDGA
jgi:hypothetical protein